MYSTVDWRNQFEEVRQSNLLKELGKSVSEIYAPASTSVYLTKNQMYKELLFETLLNSLIRVIFLSQTGLSDSRSRYDVSGYIALLRE